MSDAMRGPAFQIHSGDNVATLLADVAEGALIVLRGDVASRELRTVQAIDAGHKIATQALPAGTRVMKYGFPIGETKCAIAEGEWVHLHNCRSYYDALSSELSVETGAREATRYV